MRLLSTGVEPLQPIAPAIAGAVSCLERYTALEARAKFYSSGGCSDLCTIVYRSGFLVFKRDGRVKEMFGRVLTVVTLAAAIMLSLLVQSTSPATIGPIGLLAVFFLLYVIFVGIFTWLLHGGSVAIALALKPIVLKRPLHPLSLVHAYYYASVIALAPIILSAIQSVSQVGIYEIALIVLFLAISIFYIRKRLQ